MLLQEKKVNVITKSLIFKATLFIIILFACPHYGLSATNITYTSSNFTSEHDSSPTIFRSLNDNISVNFHSISIDIRSTTDIKCKESYLIENIGNSSINQIQIWLNHSLSSVQVIDTNEDYPLDYEWIVSGNSSNFITVNLNQSVTAGSLYSFSIFYELIVDLPLINNNDHSYYLFEYYASISYDTTVFSISFILPENSFIHEDDEVSSIYPTGATTLIDYNRVIVKWETFNVSSFSDPLYFVRFNEPIIEENRVGFFQRALNVFISGLILGAFLGVSGMSWFARYKERRAAKKIGMSLLDTNQKELIKIIYEHNGKISQKEMCDVTGFSKSKVSRNLVPLEKRGLIRREKWGRTYVVYLTNEGKSVIE